MVSLFLGNICVNVRKGVELRKTLNRPGFPGECFICELRLPDHRFRWKHNKLFLLLPEEYGPAGNDSNLLIVFYVQIMPDDFVMQLHRF